MIILINAWLLAAAVFPFCGLNFLPMAIHNNTSNLISPLKTEKIPEKKDYGKFTIIDNITNENSKCSF